MKQVEFSLNLDLSLPLLLRPRVGQGASQGKESFLTGSGREGEETARVGREILAVLCEHPE
jgi:hypothetical protein